MEFPSFALRLVLIREVLRASACHQLHIGGTVYLGLVAANGFHLLRPPAPDTTFVPLKGHIASVQVGGDDRRGEATGHVLFTGPHGGQQRFWLMQGKPQCLGVHHLPVVVHFHHQGACLLALEDKASPAALPGHVLEAQKTGVHPQALTPLPHSVHVTGAHLGHEGHPAGEFPLHLHVEIGA